VRKRYEYAETDFFPLFIIAKKIFTKKCKNEEKNDNKFPGGDFGQNFHKCSRFEVVHK